MTAEFDSCGMQFARNGKNNLKIVNKLTVWNRHEDKDGAKPFVEVGQVRANLSVITSHFCVGTRQVTSN